MPSRSIGLVLRAVESVKSRNRGVRAEDSLTCDDECCEWPPSAPALLVSGLSNRYDVTADGQRFLMGRQADAGDSTVRLNIVVNWLEEPAKGSALDIPAKPSAG
jgi:hypothetical protein